MKMRWKVINYIIKKNKYTSYLEIGVDEGINFKKIKCASKISVDPAEGQYVDSEPDYIMTSDEFFHKKKFMFDIIFIDGLHHSDQVYKDITNSLKCLNPNGTIVCHDMNPVSEESQRIPREANANVWHGDCWKAFVRLRVERDDLNMCVIDTDCGLGIIRPGTQERLLVDSEFYENYNNFVENKEKWLNLITFKEFKNEK